MRITLAVVAALVAAAGGQARAQGRAESTTDDRYCDYIEGVAAAQSALLFSPEVFGSFGYLDQLVASDQVDQAATDDLRVTAGVRYRLSGIYQGLKTRDRAHAECRRQKALDQVAGATTYRALEARAKVLEDALDEAQKILTQAGNDLDARRETAQDVTSTRLRVDELRALASDARRQLSELPPAASDQPMTRALDAYYAADADVERHEASLRRAQAWDVQVRFGYDAFLSNDNTTPYFALVQVGLNLGWFLQGSGNDRAAAGRRRLTEERGAGQGAATTTALKATLALESRREQETGVLLADLQEQLDQLKAVGGESSRRYRQTVWFEWVKVKADHAYLAAHVATLREVLGGDEEAR